ncbi:PH domain-containing protein [Halocatena halophila]|uniref:PH domain-containing protein n=1 Tax=Halocatena halophila TaxID=2814576 RepID=UPI002ED4D680
METLHPRIRFVWSILSLVLALVCGVVVVFVDRMVLNIGSWPAIVVAVLVCVLGVSYSFLRYRRWGFALSDDAIELEYGVVTLVESVVPYVRIQHVDTQRTAIDRMSGLARVVVYTAGTRGSDVTIPGLSPDRARTIQQRLRERARTDEIDAV